MRPRLLAAAFVACGLSLALPSRSAHAQERVQSALEAFGYVIPILGGAACTAVNFTTWSFDNPSPYQRSWFWAGLGFGTIDVGMGLFLALNDADGITWAPPFFIGVASITGAFLAPEPERLSGKWEPIGHIRPVVTPTFQGALYSTTF